MALLRSALTHITDSSVRAALNEDCYANSIKPALKRIRHVNSFASNPSTADCLEKLGIGTDPTSCTLHTHAACKAIENDLLEHVGRALPDEVTTMLFMKKVKLQYMRRSPKRCIFHNQVLQPRDIQRYDPDTLVDDYCKVETRVAFMSDTLHFLSPPQLVRIFKQSPSLQLMYATLVLPIEAKHKHQPAWPDLYSINYTHGGFQYLPGGHGGAAYHHEFEQLQWLSLGHIRVACEGEESFHLTLEMVESKGANHLFAISRSTKPMITPAVRTFAADEMVILPRVFLPPEYNVLQPIPKELATRMLLYVKSIKKVSIQDVWAKLRQLIKSSMLDRWDSQALLHMANYFFFVGNMDSINPSINVLEYAEWMHPLMDIWASLKLFLERMTGPKAFTQLVASLKWEPFTYSERVVTIEVSDKRHPEIKEDLDIGPGPELDEEVEDEKKQESTPPPTEVTLSERPAEPSTRADTSILPWAAWGEVLRLQGLHCDEIQMCGDDVILPITEVKSGLKREAWPDCVPEPLRVRLDKAKRRPVSINFDRSRAAAYGSDVKNARVGALLKAQDLSWRCSFAFKCEQESRVLPGVVIHGAGGSGKSFLVQEAMRSLGREMVGITVVVPTTELLTDWRAKVPMAKLDSFKTFEKALVQQSGPIAIFDDYGKLPAGYVEAFVMNRPNLEFVILTGDSKQSVHHERNTDAYSAHIPPAVEVYSEKCGYYLNATHRNAKVIANALGVYSVSKNLARITQSSNFLPGVPVLVPSQVKQSTFGDLGVRAFTYTGCQGLTVPEIQIVLDSDTPACSARAFYTALSRAKTRIHFVNTGPNSTQYWDKLDSTPYLKTFLELSREEAMKEASCSEAEPQPEGVPQTHLPVVNEGMLLEPLIEDIPDKHDRELFSEKHGFSNCIQTDEPVVQLFQHQQAKDETLNEATIKKRIVVSSPEKNEAEFLAKSDLGDVLFENYKVAMGLPLDPVPFEPELWEAAKREVQETYLKKPTHQLINASKRQSPDFEWNKIDLFLKSQWKAKVSSIGEIKVKEGQTIASFMQETVMLFGTMARYLRRQRDRFQPEWILINCEKTPEKIDLFLKENWSFDQPSFTNDFSAFDQSQDGAMLQFEMLKCKFFNIPEKVCEAYLFIKTHAQIYLGTLAIMRLTGEGPTFDANTECNIAFQHTKHHIPPRTAQMYAGDDSAIDHVCVEKKSFGAIAHRFSLTSKEKIYSQTKGDWAEFCGWQITPGGLLKDPMKLHASIKLKEKTSKTKEYLDCFSRDCFRAYKLGDGVYDVFSEGQMDFHEAAVRNLVLSGFSPALYF
nr:MAG: putative replication protein [Sichuan alphaflexivirus 1]